jgi:YD repeat-containing protein
MTPGSQPTDGIVTKPSPLTVSETVSRLTGLVEDKNLTLFEVIDHSGQAKKVGLEMPDTKLVIFGSPAAGTPVMVAAPLAALDLPLKILVWTDADGVVSVSYNSAGYLASRHHLTDELRSRLEGIESISDATVSNQ